jgi:hypothetical protein
MYNIILQKKNATQGAAPTSAQLVVGEIAINTADGNVFVKTDENTVVNLLDYSIADGGEVT